MAWKIPILTLIRNNILAIISLLMAMASLSYNTWRNDATEANRNHRAAGFAVAASNASSCAQDERPKRVTHISWRA